MGIAYSGLDTYQQVRNNIPDFLRTISVEVRVVKDRKICKYATMIKKLKSFGEVWIASFP